MLIMLQTQSLKNTNATFHSLKTVKMKHTTGRTLLADTPSNLLNAQVVKVSSALLVMSQCAKDRALISAVSIPVTVTEANLMRLNPAKPRTKQNKKQL